MPKKSFKKKKAYQAMCRDMVRQGKVNDANGNWISMQTGKAMHDMMKAGYKL